MTNVKWENEKSRDFRVPPVIKQGGKNSPDLKKNYIDDLAAILAGELGYCYFIGKKKKKTLIRQKYERYFESSLLTSIITFLCRGMFRIDSRMP